MRHADIACPLISGRGFTVAFQEAERVCKLAYFVALVSEALQLAYDWNAQSTMLNA